MAKKSDKKKDKSMEPKPVKNTECCQYCKSHMNHPSKCKLSGKYVSRKHEACDSFKR